MRYAAPDSVDDAVALLASTEGRGRVLAGGSDLLVQLRAGRVEAELVVAVKRIERMTTLSRDARGFRIGAAVCGAVMAEDTGLARAWPGVVEAVQLIGSTQIQGRASLGGNLCNASPAADGVPALVTADARCVVAGPAGERESAVSQVATGPGETSLSADEILVEILLPHPPPRSADAYLRMTPRSEMDIAVVGAAARVSLDEEGRCSGARVALGSVGPTVREVHDAGAILVGGTLDDAALSRLAEAARETAAPIDDLRGSARYRTRITGVLSRRAAAIAKERARERR
jgi:carbon-monoxide dehydrogenase medium subunit